MNDVTSHRSLPLGLLFLLLTISAVAASQSGTTEIRGGSLRTPVDTLSLVWEVESYGNEALFRPTYLEVTSWGEVWVTDSGAKTLYRWTLNGDEVGRVGREGAGPGEFIQPSLVFETGGGQVGVWDQRTQRLSLFDKNGEFVRMTEVAVNYRTHGFARRFRLVGDTSYVFTNNYPNPRPRDIEDRSFVWRLVGAALEGDSLLSFPGPQMIVERAEGTSTRFNAPFQRRAELFFLPDGRMLLGPNDDERFQILDETFTVVDTLRTQLPVLEVLEEEKVRFSDSIRVTLESTIQRAGIGPTDRDKLRRRYDRILARLDWPESHPLYIWSWVDPSGESLWLQLPYRRNAEFQEWRAYSIPRGDHFRTVIIPNRGLGYMAHFTPDSELFMIELDSMRVGRVVKYGRK